LGINDLNANLTYKTNPNLTFFNQNYRTVYLSSDDKKLTFFDGTNMSVLSTTDLTFNGVSVKQSTTTTNSINTLSGRISTNTNNITTLSGLINTNTNSITTLNSNLTNYVTNSVLSNTLIHYVNESDIALYAPLTQPNFKDTVNFGMNNSTNRYNMSLVNTNGTMTFTTNNSGTYPFQFKGQLQNYKNGTYENVLTSSDISAYATISSLNNYALNSSLVNYVTSSTL
jgi:hypothetical protein